MGTPQSFPMASLPIQLLGDTESSEQTSLGRALRSGPYPQVGAGSGLEGVRPLVPATRTPSRLACRTRAVWQCRPAPSLSGLLPPSPASPGSGCPRASSGCCDSPKEGSFHPLTVKQRLVAHGTAPVDAGGFHRNGLDAYVGEELRELRQVSSRCRKALLAHVHRPVGVDDPTACDDRVRCMSSPATRSLIRFITITSVSVDRGWREKDLYKAKSRVRALVATLEGPPGPRARLTTRSQLQGNVRRPLPQATVSISSLRGGCQAMVTNTGLARALPSS